MRVVRRSARNVRLGDWRGPLKNFIYLAGLVLGSLLGLVAPAAAGDEVGRAPPAGWIDELAVPAPRPERLRQVEDGIYYLLLDTLIKPDGAAQTYYTRSVYKVTDRTGLEEAARFDIDYDPSQEQVVLHHIRVIRDGVATDRMAGADIEVLRREQSLDKGIFDGRKTVHIEIKDVRVGDIIDYAYSWVSHASFWPGHFFGHVSANWAVPLELTRYRLIWPTDRALAIRNRNTGVQPTRTRVGDDTIYEWRIGDAELTRSENGTPAWYPTWGNVEVSSMTRWAEVVDWALPLYSGHDTLPPQLADRAGRIMAKYPKPEDRITEAMRLVEDDVRYVSLSMGAGSYTPRSPAEVVRSGFGDCKDKSQLLVALLRRMGVEAYVALTDLDEGQGLAQMPPSANIFDHAIVQVRFKGRSYWLDPTGSNEGGRFPNLAALNYGWALPVAKGQSRLERIARPEPVHPAFRTVERYELGAGPQPGMTLRVETTYLAGEADAMRGSIASKSQAQLEGDYLKFYVGLYPGLTRQQPLRIRDDRDANRIVTNEVYFLSPANLRSHKLMEKFIVKASSLDAYADVPSGKRQTPYVLSWPIDRQQTIVLVTPGRRPPAPGPVSITDAGFRYDLAATRDGDTLTLNYRLAGVTDVLAAKDVADVSSDAGAVSDDNYWYLDLTSTAGGTMGADATDLPRWQDIVLYLLATIGAASLCAAAGYALNRGLHADDAWSGDGIYYPVSLGEFILMNVVTAGMFSFFWMWKCWRWAKPREHPHIQPFWRALFSMIWLYPLFADAARRERLPLWLRLAGIGGAALYLVWIAASITFSAMGVAPVLVTLVGAASFVCFLPALLAVNRLNAARPRIELANSAMTSHTTVALLLGLAYWVAILAMAHFGIAVELPK